MPIAILDITRQSLRKLRLDEDNSLPAMKVGREFRYDLEEVREWARRRAKIQPGRRKVRRRIKV